MAKRKKSASKRRPATTAERLAAIREIRKRLEEPKTARVIRKPRGGREAYLFTSEAKAEKYALYRKDVLQEPAEVIRVREVK